MIILTWLKRWGYAIVGALLATLGVASVYYKKKGEKYKIRADTLKATVHAERTRKKIEKKKKEELSRRESDIKKETEKKDEKDFNGIDNLTDSNDW